MIMIQRLLVVCALVGGAAAEPPAWGDWIPRNAAWRERLDYRLEQIRRIEGSQERWDGIMNLAVSGLLVPNYTDVGYKVVATPAHVQKKLNDTLRAALRDGRVTSEHRVDQISGPAADFVRLGRLNDEVMRDMLAMHEAWSGVPLTPSNAYGLRLYKDRNTLTMHTDRVETHVVSSIVHVDRDLDEPWPIVIEGYDGKSVAVDLAPGETLFYESAKCIHGRPKPMKGRFYTSLFLHYRPRDWRVRMDDARRIVEPEFEKRDFTRPPSDAFDALRLTGTGYYEPDCAHRWCGLVAATDDAGDDDHVGASEL